jgi:uncharacterized membrane protein YeaQ/YmgE (transglycosylase-associated protein family)
MDSTLMSWLASLVSGGAGGNSVGALLKGRSRGPMMNTILGLIGGALGGQFLPNLMNSSQSAAPDGGGGSLLGNVGASLVGGVVLPLLASLLAKKKAA